MGQLFDRLRDLAKSHLRDQASDRPRLDTRIDDDDELRRIIDELHRDYESSSRQSAPRSSTTEDSASTVRVPSDVLHAHTVLNVPVGSTTDMIKSAYKTAIARWHPDKFAHGDLQDQQQAHSRAHEINSAYMKLRDHYDFR